jgi:hypothetical protein
MLEDHKQNRDDNKPNITPDTIPPAAPILIEWLPCADGPVAILIGNKPNTKASDVITIGRILNLAASMAASTRPCPAFLYSKLYYKDGVFSQQDR